MINESILKTGNSQHIDNKHLNYGLKTKTLFCNDYIPTLTLMISGKNTEFMLAEPILYVSETR